MDAGPSTLDLAAELDRRIARLTLQSRQSFRELSRTAVSVLARLRDGGPQRVTALATAEAVAQPTMTGLLGRLERQGLVTRGGDPADGRAVRVAITADGLAALERFRRARAALLDARLAALDPADREAIATALPALQRLIDVEEAPR